MMIPNITLVITNIKMGKLHPRYSDREIYCGNNLKNKDTPERKYILTSGTHFDVEEILSQLNEDDKKIDLVVLNLEYNVSCFPKNLYKIDCPKIVIITDTFHLRYPISSIINYLKQEDIKHILTAAQPAHLHFFYEIGIKHSAMYPRKVLNLENSHNKTTGITYIGKKWKSSHLRKSRMVQFLEKKLPKFNIPFNYYNRLPYPEWIETMCKSKMVVISSLNGQFTPQIYSALSAGVLCFVDKLSSQTFLYNFFEPNEHLITWNNFNNLLNKIIYYYDRPKKAESIANAGKQQVNMFTTNKRTATMISEFVFEDKINPKLLAINDKRCQDKRVEHPDYFDARVRLYENIQELHRIHESLKLISFTQRNLKVISDLADLPRLKITHLFTSDKLKTKANLYFQSVCVDHQIKTDTLNNIQELSTYNIGILETQECFIDSSFLVGFISELLKKKSLLFVFGELTPSEFIMLKEEGFKSYKLKDNFIKKISRKICLWFWKKGKYPFPYLTLKPAMKTVPNLNVFIRGWQSKLQKLY